jgi:hypothetical protein
MAQEDKENTFFEEHFRRALKSLKIEEIEEMIGKVLGNAAGREYQVEVKNINFNPVEHSSTNDET